MLQATRISAAERKLGSIDTAEDILERGIKILYSPGTDSMVETLKQSPFPLTRKLAENTFVPQVLQNLIKYFSILMIVMGRG